VSKDENILNSIYCLSQEACSTLTKLRLIPNIAKDINSYRLYVLLENLLTDALEAFKTMTLDLSEVYLNEYIEELFSIGSIIKETYQIFKVTADMPNENRMIKKLEHQIDSLLLVLFKLYKLDTRTRCLNQKGFITEYLL
jgi:hypothetical protein